MSTTKKISITVVVSGQPTVIDVIEDAPLRTIIPDALRQTENSGQPPENWELRDADGTLLDLNKKIGDYGFQDKTRLFLSLKAGVGGHGNVTEQYVDPAVSRAKFDREITDYRSIEADYRARGWFLVKAHWPVAEVVFASNKTNPTTIVTAARFDFTNYDAEPPSVRLIDPFSARFLLSKELPTRLPRMTPGPEIPVPGGPKVRLNTAQDLMQAHLPEDLPFLCIPGVKEYHDHPGHSGDPWELHRSSGEGRLVHLLGVISKYGLEPVKDFHVNLVPQVTFAVSEPPQ